MTKPPIWRRLWPFAQAGEKARDKAATCDKFYTQIVARARRVEDFEGFGIADTTDNRREWLGCWCALVMIRLHRIGPEGARLAQALFDRAFADLEENFREQGVADMSIGKHVKKAAATFLARYRDIEHAIDNSEPLALAISLDKHMQIERENGSVAMAELLLRSVAGLASASDESVLRGQLRWDLQSQNEQL